MYRIKSAAFSLSCLLLSLLIVPSAQAEKFHPALSLQGFTGILNTPNAAVTGEGNLYLLFSNQRERLKGKRTLPSWQENYMFSLGLFDLLEIGGRLTETTRHAVNDLSGNVKVKVPFIPEDGYFPMIAFGIQDFSGGSDHRGSSALLRSKYVVVSEDLWRFRLSLGYGDGPDRMEGVFGGVEFKAADWLYLLGENDTKYTNAGIRLVTPHILGYPVNFQVTAKTALNDRAGNTEFGFGLQMPLGFERHNKTPAPAVQAAPEVDKAEPVQRQEEAKPAGLPAATVPEPVHSETDAGRALSDLRKKLIDAGFENIRIGAKRQELVVEYENSRYNHNELDSIGVVAGTVIDSPLPGFDSLTLVTRKKGIRVMQLSAPLGLFRLFLHNADYLSDFGEELRISYDVTHDEEVTWQEGDTNPSWLKSSVVLYPGLQTIIGNENGAFNYLLSFKIDHYLNAWKGAVVNARWDIPLSWSENYDNGRVFRNQRHDNRLERLMLFQTIKLAPTLMANLGAGMVLHDQYGTLNELMWTPGEGTHRFTARQTFLRADGGGGDRNTDSYLGSYRYYFSPLDLYLEGTGGKFLNEDTGGMAELKRFFGDTSFSLYYKNTKNVKDERIEVGGVQFVFPLTPRRDMKPYAVQVRGSDEWSYAFETRIADDELNFLYDPVGINPQPYYRLEHIFYNRDRLSEPYIRKHLLRLRDAYLKYVVNGS